MGRLVGLMQLRLLTSLLALAAAACGSEPSAPALTEADLVGRWELHRQANSDCVGAAGEAIYYFTVTDPVKLESGSILFVSSWDVVNPPRFDWTLGGNFAEGPSGVELRFWLRTLDVGQVFYGTLAPDWQSATGTLRDPIPGYNPHFVLGSCTFDATIRRMSP